MRRQGGQTRRVSLLIRRGQEETAQGTKRFAIPLYVNPHLLTRPDWADPAVCFVGLSGAMFLTLLSRGKWG
jgi:hypothetical protein